MPAWSEIVQAELTVAIPLFNARKWFFDIVQNIERLPSHARIVLSDGVGSDDTAQRLAEYFAKDERIVLRLRQDEVGWRRHCNALIAECETPFFSLLPQDDLVHAGYHQHLIEGLKANESCVLAFGVVYLSREGHLGSQECMASPPITLGVGLPWQEAVHLDRHWNMGVAFRSVIRREVLRPIPATPGDAFADQMWVFKMALNGHLLEVPQALYLKRYHSENTHTTWNALTNQQRLEHLKKQVCEELAEQLWPEAHQALELSYRL